VLPTTFLAALPETLEMAAGNLSAALATAGV
jgi:hypothetical protein